MSAQVHDRIAIEPDREGPAEGQTLITADRGDFGRTLAPPTPSSHRFRSTVLRPKANLSHFVRDKLADRKALISQLKTKLLVGPTQVLRWMAWTTESDRRRQQGLRRRWRAFEP